jgi:DNA processing protein
MGVHISQRAGHGGSLDRNAGLGVADLHTETQPLDDPTLIASLQLAGVAGLGSTVCRRLIRHFGGPCEVLEASAADLTCAGLLRPAVAEAIAESSDEEAVKTLDLCRRRGVEILLERDPRYPPLLGRIDDSPGLLFVRGEIQPCDALAVAIVGARHATTYGVQVAEQLGGALARAGYTVVSGLARGIDAAGHRGALAAGGRTLAVLGSGVLSVYPPENQSLAEEVIASGAVISESPPLTKPNPGLFPQRNRIISGLSLGVVVVQAAERSGAMITARLAGEQGREVFAVPGDIGCRMSKGCHKLIQDGAKLVGGIDDILEELGPLFEAVVATEGFHFGSAAGHASVSPAVSQPRRAAEQVLGETERQVFAAVPDGPEGCLIDCVIDHTGLAASQVLATLSTLETRRLVKRLAGSRVARR